MITKRTGSPFFQVDVTQDGRRLRVSTRCRRKADAQAVAAKIIAEGRAGDRQTLGDAWAAWSAAKRAEGRSVSYMTHAEKMYAKTIGRTKRPFWHMDPKAPCARVDQKAIDTLREQRAAEGAKPGTIGAELRILRAVMEHAARRGVKVGKVFSWAIPKEGQRLRYLTREEAERLVATLGAKTLEGEMVTVLLGTGLRWHELAGLTWQMLDDRRGVLRVVGKGRKGRDIPLTGPALQVLRDRQRMARGAAMGGGAGWLFADPMGRPYDVTPTRIAWGIDEAGLNAPEMVASFGRVSTHTLRHTYATWLRQGGMQLDDIQALLGHSTVTLTMRYAKLDTDGLAGRVAAALDNKQTPMEGGAHGS